MDPAINVRIRAQFDTDPDRYTETLSKGPIADWNSKIYFPKVHFATITPRWQESRNKTWSTRATGLYGPSVFSKFFKQIIADIELKEDRFTFMDKALQNSTPAHRAEYGKAVTSH